MTLEVIYQLLLVFGLFATFQWVTTTNFDPNSPWLIGIVCAPASLLLTFVNYFIRDRIKTLQIKKLRATCSPDFVEDVLRAGNY